MKETRLFSPITLRRLSIPNRVFMSPMCQYSAVDGKPTDWHRIHYGSRAVGGTGLVMLEATAVAPEGRISFADLGIWSDEQADALAPLARSISESGAVPALQLAHAGRKASSPRPWAGPGPEAEGGSSWPLVSSTSSPFSRESPTPRALTTKDIAEIVRAFASAACRAVGAGFKVVEIHAAHGYLLHQFLSPLCNDREDAYGGDYSCRIRIVRETLSAVREAVGDDIPVFVRLSASDWCEGGWTLKDSVLLAKTLKDSGADLIDCSSGGIAPGISIPLGPGYQTSFAETVRREGDIPTAAVGMITEATQAEHIIGSGQADAVFLGRALLRNPYWPRRAAAELGQVITAPPQYQRAW